VLKSEYIFKDLIVCTKKKTVFIQNIITLVTKSAFNDFVRFNIKDKDIKNILRIS
jgi:hypothetical protein